MRWICVPILLAACGVPDRVAPAFTAYDWRLAAIDGVAFPATATLDIRPTGLVLGRTPCNRFAGTLTRWPPGWEFGPLRLRDAPCPQGNAEAAFIAALTRATRAEVTGTMLELRGPGGLVLQFRRSFPPG